MKMRTEYTCPLELVHDMVKGKWKPIILWRLRLGATSLAKLEWDIDGYKQCREVNCKWIEYLQFARNDNTDKKNCCKMN